MTTCICYPKHVTYIGDNRTLKKASSNIILDLSLVSYSHIIKFSVSDIRSSNEMFCVVKDCDIIDDSVCKNNNIHHVPFSNHDAWYPSSYFGINQPLTQYRATFVIHLGYPNNETKSDVRQQITTFKVNRKLLWFKVTHSENILATKVGD